MEIGTEMLLPSGGRARTASAHTPGTTEYLTWLSPGGSCLVAAAGGSFELAPTATSCVFRGDQPPARMPIQAIEPAASATSVMVDTSRVDP